MDLQTECFQVFSEMDTLCERLSSLGREAKLVLAKMINSGVGLDSITFLLAKARKAERAMLVEEVEKEKVEDIKEKRRCKWFNRGYCKEKERCSFVHPRQDCQEHLQGRCTIRGCTLRHRRVCKFNATKEGCIRGKMCEYIHNELPKQKYTVEDVVETEEIKKEKVIMESKAAQTDDVSEKCICMEEVEKNELIMKEDKMICLFKRVKCDQNEWDEIDDAVEDSEIDLEEMLDQWSKVMEGYYRRENKKE